MAGSVNLVLLIGNVGKDPEIRTLQNGDKVASFSLATSETWRDKSSGEKKERTEWTQISIFNEGLVKVVESYVKRGSKVAIQGQLQTRKWTDKNGQDRYTTEVVLRPFRGELTLLGGKGEGGGSSGGGGGGSDDDYGFTHGQDKRGGPREPTFDLDDEIPFVSRGGLL